MVFVWFFDRCSSTCDFSLDFFEGDSLEEDIAVTESSMSFTGLLEGLAVF